MHGRLRRRRDMLAPREASATWRSAHGRRTVLPSPDITIDAHTRNQIVFGHLAPTRLDRQGIIGIGIIRSAGLSSFVIR